MNRIDLGCGSAKKSGTIGIDFQAFPGVDIVLDIVKNRLPFEDDSVEYIHSAHFLEHLHDIGPILKEVTRVSAPNAKLEFWTPYAWSNLAFVFDHKLFLTEEVWLHMGVYFPDFWTKMLGARWVLDELRFIVVPEALETLNRQGVSLEFALKHLHNIAPEFGAYMTCKPDINPITPPPVKVTYSFTRDGERYPLSAGVPIPPVPPTRIPGPVPSVRTTINEAARALLLRTVGPKASATLERAFRSLIR